MAVAAAVAVVAGVSLGATSIVLNNAIDDQLVEQAQASADTIQTNALGSGVQAFSFGLEGQFLDAAGNPLENAVSPWNRVRIPVSAADAEVARGQRTQNLRTITVNGQSYRLVTVPLQRPAVAAALQLARPTTDVDRTLRDLGLVLLVVGVVGVVGSALAGRIVARAALKPVDAAAAAAEEVARTQNLSALIPVIGTDEIARLAESLNSMLRALEASRARQRQLVDDASHELRTPLTSLRTNIELLLRSEANPHRPLPAADRQALLRDVDAQMRELSGLVSELVELARDEMPAEEAERLDLADIVRAAAERARRRANGKGILIEVEIDGAGAAPTATAGSGGGSTLGPVITGGAGHAIDGRANLLERAVTNLLDNAVKFSPPTSVVRIRCRGTEVTVIDEGPGIASEDRAQVFDRFYRATSARGLPGSGLGLAIVADAVATHGGWVRAEAAPGGGALLRMWLPPAGPGPIHDFQDDTFAPPVSAPVPVAPDLSTPPSPASGPPASGPPASGPPASGPAASGLPASGLPALGPAVAWTPLDDGPASVSPWSRPPSPSPPAVPAEPPGLAREGDARAGRGENPSV
ncbi:HAMP domain-containing sensor histidine kinase [Frankia sp. AiPa1]|uniref:HAMP domain-containing sensor histidine kinase n=1 Tax=Frankia sp. AiPa1 TaxID=573492 RepID=UPI00202ADF5D|nr:HAMP domain-containing sensor histidine kinase [Frankia sp. AiPa1]MCL9762915.1 HAMP domain-containing histidine kinase [Frankia sp. AiPa1]